MARHIYIGLEATVAYDVNGFLANGAIDVQKLSMSGPTSMVPGDIRTNTEQFRIVQGTGIRDIVSPWLYGKDIINWDGKNYTAPRSHKHTLTFVGTTTAAGTVSIKIVRTDVPGYPTFSFDVAVASGVGAAAVGPLVTTAYAAADVPEWLDAVSANGGATSVIEGSVAGNTNDNGTIWDENPSTFVVSVTDIPVGITASWTLDSAPSQDANAGAGSGYLVRKIEEQWWGNQFGVYDRAGIPKNPLNYSVLATAYDVYSIAATKDGSSQSQVHGVDNIMEIAIATANGAGAADIEAKLNPYMNDCGFASVVI